MPFMSKLLEIEKTIIEAIKNKELLPGDKVMSENDILSKFSVSRMTSRKAIQNLVSRGYLYQKKGSGTYVADRENKIEINLNDVIGFTDRMKKLGKTPITKIITFKKTKSYPYLSEKLKISDSDNIFYIERVRYMEDIPIALEYTYMPYNIVHNLKKKDLEISKYQYLNSIGLKIGKSVREYFPTIPSKEVKDILEIPNSTPVFKIELVSYLVDMTPFEFSKIFYNQTKCKFVQVSQKGEDY